MFLFSQPKTFILWSLYTPSYKLNIIFMNMNTHELSCDVNLQGILQTRELIKKWLTVKLRDYLH